MGAAIFVGNLRFGNVIHLQFDSSGYNFVHAKHVTNRSPFVVIIIIIKWRQLQKETRAYKKNGGNFKGRLLAGLG